MAAKKKATSKTAAQKPPTKSQIIGQIADKTGLTRKDVGAVFDNLNAIIKRNMGRRGPGEFTMPGLVKFKVDIKPATKARKGVNPFTGQEMVFKAKPKRKVVKVRVLKGLKDML